MNTGCVVGCSIRPVPSATSRDPSIASPARIAHLVRPALVMPTLRREIGPGLTAGKARDGPQWVPYRDDDPPKAHPDQ